MQTRQKSNNFKTGFTITEVIITSILAGFLGTVASTLMISNIKSEASMEAVQRKQEAWSQVADFIKTEATLSEEIITSNLATELSACDSSEPTANVHFALKIRPDLPSSVYYFKPSQNGFAGTHSLFRCGPRVDRDGNYSTSKEISFLADGMNTNTCGISITKATKKSIDFVICSQGVSSTGLSGSEYEQSLSASSRINPVPSIFPPTKLRLSPFCDPITSGTTSTKTLTDGSTLICGSGGTFAGTTANEILEIDGEVSATINAGSGNDILSGNDANNTLNGEGGDDMLLAGGGNDTINGGDGADRIVIKSGNDSINGGSGFDILYIETEATIDFSSCSQSSCSLTYDGNTINVSNTELIVTRVARKEVN